MAFRYVYEKDADETRKIPGEQRITTDLRDCLTSKDPYDLLAAWKYLYDCWFFGRLKTVPTVARPTFSSSALREGYIPIYLAPELATVDGFFHIRQGRRFPPHYSFRKPDSMACHELSGWLQVKESKDWRFASLTLAETLSAIKKEGERPMSLNAYLISTRLSTMLNDKQPDFNLKIRLPGTLLNGVAVRAEWQGDGANEFLLITADKPNESDVNLTARSVISLP